MGHNYHPQIDRRSSDHVCRKYWLIIRDNHGTKDLRLVRRCGDSAARAGGCRGGRPASGSVRLPARDPGEQLAEGGGPPSAAVERGRRRRLLGGVSGRGRAGARGAGAVAGAVAGALQRRLVQLAGEA